MRIFRALFRPANIFTFLVIALTFAFVFRLVNIATFYHSPQDGIGITRSANAGGFSPQQLHAPPPPAEATPSQDDLNNAVKDAARKADDGDSAAPADSAAPKSDAKKEDEMPPPPDGGNTSFSASEIEVLQSLAKRRDDLDRREKRLSEREALLSAAEQEVDHKITELNKLKGEIEGLLGQQQKLEDDRITSLVKIYEGMKPKEAATIFNTLDMDVLLPVISRMSERKSGPILASMEPDKARIVTIRLAQQRELPAANALKKAVQGQMGAEPPP